MKRILLSLLLFVTLCGRTASADEGESGAEASQRRVAEQQRLLSDLWAFASLNYLYCDVIGLMDSKMLKQYQTGKVGGMTINEKFLLGGTLLMEVPMSMVFLSTALKPGASRIANISAGALMTAVQAATLFVARPTSYYLASSVAEIGTTGFITAYAALAMKPPRVVPSVEAKPGAFALKVGFTF